MLIINYGKKDYYDSSMGIDGIDKTIVYERHEEVFSRHEGNYYMPDEIHKIFYPKSKYHNDYHFELIKKHPDDFFNMFVVGFCGKFYFGMKFYETPKNYKSYTTNTEIKEFITFDTDVMKNHIKDKRGYASKMKDHAKLDELVIQIKNIKTQDTFRKFNTPVFVYRFGDGYCRTSCAYQESQFIVNPCLKDYDFYRIFDSFTCFQEISMYISGVLGNREKDIIEVADKYKIAQHGFDKWSFRRMPEKK